MEKCGKFKQVEYRNVCPKDITWGPVGRVKTPCGARRFTRRHPSSILLGQTFLLMWWVFLPVEGSNSEKVVTFLEFIPRKL
jgi:hypothetical protein